MIYVMINFVRYMEAEKWETIPRNSHNVCWLAHFAPQLSGSRIFYSNEIYT